MQNFCILFLKKIQWIVIKTLQLILAKHDSVFLRIFSPLNIWVNIVLFKFNLKSLWGDRWNTASLLLFIIYSRLMKLFLSIRHHFINVRTNKENSLINLKIKHGQINNLNLRFKSETLSQNKPILLANYSIWNGFLTFWIKD